MKKHLFVLSFMLIAINLSRGDAPSTPSEKHYDNELKSIVRKIAADPAFSRFFSSHVSPSHTFQHASSGDKGWITESNLSRDVKQIPNPSGSQTVFRREVDTDDGIYLNIFIVKDKVNASTASNETFLLANERELRLGYLLVVKGDKMELRKRLDSIISSSDLKVGRIIGATM
jgi:hypothetical protein